MWRRLPWEIGLWPSVGRLAWQAVEPLGQFRISRWPRRGRAITCSGLLSAGFVALDPAVACISSGWCKVVAHAVVAGMSSLIWSFCCNGDMRCHVEVVCAGWLLGLPEPWFGQPLSSDVELQVQTLLQSWLV